MKFLTVAIVLVSLMGCSHSSSPSPQPTPNPTPVVVVTPSPTPVASPSPSVAPNYLADTEAQLVQKGTAGSFCIKVTELDGSSHQLDIPNGFGPCLGAYHRADGKYYSTPQ